MIDFLLSDFFMLSDHQKNDQHQEKKFTDNEFSHPGSSCIDKTVQSN